MENDTTIRDILQERIMKNWYFFPSVPAHPHFLLPVSFFPRFLSFFSLFSANERRNSGIIGLYVSPPRQYTHPLAQWRSCGRSRFLSRYHYVTKSHLCSEKSELYRNSVSRWEKLGIIFDISVRARGGRERGWRPVNRNETGHHRVDRGWSRSFDRSFSNFVRFFPHILPFTIIHPCHIFRSTVPADFFLNLFSYSRLSLENF